MNNMSYDDIARQREQYAQIRNHQSRNHDRKVNYVSEDCTRCGQPATLTDKQGNKWCEVHRDRFELLNWGHDHQFPTYYFDGLVSISGEVQPAKYAVGEGYALWFTMCGIGNDTYFPSEEDEV